MKYASWRVAVAALLSRCGPLPRGAIASVMCRGTRGSERETCKAAVYTSVNRMVRYGLLRELPDGRLALAETERARSLLEHVDLIREILAGDSEVCQRLREQSATR